MKKELYVIGAGSVGGHIALNIVDYSKEYKVAGFFDDDPDKVGEEFFGFKVLGTVDEAMKLQDTSMVIGVAFPQMKKKIVQKLSSNLSIYYPSFIHRRTWISNQVTVERGCIIYPGTAINYGSEIKAFAVINMNCSLGHHTVVGRFSSLAPGVNTAGHTQISEGVDLGIGVSTRQEIKIGEDSTVGGQSMVIKDIKSQSKVVGVPAKPISNNRSNHT